MTDYGSGYRDGKRLAGLDQHVALQRKQREIDLLVEALMKEKRENARLRKVMREIACTDNDCSAVKPFECPIDDCIHGKARAALGEGK